MANRSIKIPEASFVELTALKIRVANSIGRIPTSGSIIAFSLSLASEHYSELLTALADSEDSE
jgi:hypothetical protein